MCAGRLLKLLLCGRILCAVATFYTYPSEIYQSVQSVSAATVMRRSICISYIHAGGALAVCVAEVGANKK